MFVKPAPGRSVRRPDTLNRLAAEGEDMPRDEFWIRRLRDGDVVECDPPRTEKAEVPENEAKAPSHEEESAS